MEIESVVELSGYLEIARYLAPAERDRLRAFVADRHEVGDPVVAGGGVRQLHWIGDAEGAGGYVIYLVDQDERRVFLVGLFEVDVLEALNDDERQRVALAAESVVAEYRARRR